MSISRATEALPTGLRSLVIAPQWIGDAVMTEPLLRQLHARGEALTVAALPWVAPVYRSMASVTDVLELPFAHGALHWHARRKLARSLQGRFDGAYVCPNSIKSALLPWWAGVPRRIGYHGEGRWWLLTQRLANPEGTRAPMVEFYGALSGLPWYAGVRPALQVSDQELAHTLARWELPRGDYLVLAPGAEYGEAKRWPIAHFTRLAQQYGGRVVIVGSPKEQPLGQAIATGSGGQASGRCINLAGGTTLAQAMALIAGARTMVSNDSGLMHVAAALDVPQVALFGSSSPRHTPPLNLRAQVIWLKDDPDYQPALACAPCFERACPLGHTRCLNDISPARVLQLL